MINLNLQFTTKLPLPERIKQSSIGLWECGDTLYHNFYCITVYHPIYKRQVYYPVSYLKLCYALKIEKALKECGFKAWVDPCFYKLSN